VHYRGLNKGNFNLNLHNLIPTVIFLKPNFTVILIWNLTPKETDQEIENKVFRKIKWRKRKKGQVMDP